MPFLLLIIGFIGAALVAVMDANLVNWIWYSVPLLLGFFGVFLHRRKVHLAASDNTLVTGNIATLDESLTALITKLTAINERRKEIPVDEFRMEIDQQLRSDLYNFAEARQSMRQAFGLQAYADIMSAFASGERYINRVWSASADGYIDEVTRYIERSLKQFKNAQVTFEKWHNTTNKE